MDLLGIACYSMFLFGYVEKQLLLCEMQTKLSSLLGSCSFFIPNYVCELFHTFELVSEVGIH